MKCTHCGKYLKGNAKTCKHCGVRILRPSDTLSRKMTASPLSTLVAGAILIAIAVGAALADAYAIAAVTAVIGTVLMLIGRAMR